MGNSAPLWKRTPHTAHLSSGKRLHAFHERGNGCTAIEWRFVMRMLGFRQARGPPTRKCSAGFSSCATTVTELEAGNLNAFVWTPTVPMLWEHSGTRHDDWAVAVSSQRVLTSAISSLLGVSSCLESGGSGARDEHRAFGRDVHPNVRATFKTHPQRKCLPRGIASTHRIIPAARYPTGSSTPNHESGIFTGRRWAVLIAWAIFSVFSLGS